MAEAKRDQNFITTILGVASEDGVTPRNVGITADHSLEVDDDTTGSDLSGDDAYRDQNFVTTMIAVSEDDGVTPVPLYVNSDGKLLVDSN